jgi:hypothetical protein
MKLDLDIELAWSFLNLKQYLKSKTKGFKNWKNHVETLDV